MATVYGNTGLVPQQGASLTIGELETREIHIEGGFDALSSEYHQGGSYNGDYIKSVSIQQEEGGRAIATLQVVTGITWSTLSGVYFGVTWEIDIKEVSKSLKTHPHVTASDLEIIRLWEATPEAKRVQYATDGTPSFFYYATDGTPTVGCNRASESTL